MHDKGHIPLDGKPIKSRSGFDQFQESPSANGVDDTTVNDSPCTHFIVETNSGQIVPLTRSRRFNSSELGNTNPSPDLAC